VEQKEETVRMPEPFEENRRKQFTNQGMTSTGIRNGVNISSEQGKNSLVYEANAKDAFQNKVAEQNLGFPTLQEGTLGLKGASIKAISENNVSKPDLNLSHQQLIDSPANIQSKTTSHPQYTDDAKLADQSKITNQHKFTDQPEFTNQPQITSEAQFIDLPQSTSETQSDFHSQRMMDSENIPFIQSAEQMNLFSSMDTATEAPFLSKKALEEHSIIGQVFSTYWLVEYKKELYIIDQHAAHEKVLYERIMSAAKEKTYESQQLLPPIVLTLTLREQEVLRKHEDVLQSIGYEFEHFGGNEYSVRAVPADLYSISEKELLLEFLDDLTEDFVNQAPTATSILERVASLSCKAAVKANHTFSHAEATALIQELLTLENPYHCPHGRPVIISMSQYELERKFKRIL
jgi:DNA mismatch repair protein MutL